MNHSGQPRRLIPAHDEEASIGNVFNILGKLSVTSHDRAAAAARRLRLFASFPAGTLPGP